MAGDVHKGCTPKDDEEVFLPSAAVSLASLIVIYVMGGLRVQMTVIFQQPTPQS